MTVKIDVRTHFKLTKRNTTRESRAVCLPEFSQVIPGEIPDQTHKNITHSSMMGHKSTKVCATNGGLRMLSILTIEPVLKR